MNLNVYAPMLLCLVPFITTFLLLAILVPGISISREFLGMLAGLVAFVPIVILQFFFFGRLQKFMQTNLFLSIIHSLIFFGLIEEGVKATSLLILKSRGESLRNFFAYSILAGMTLGCFESVVYLLATFGTRSQVSSGFLRMIFLRMTTSLAIHTLCAGLGGLCIFYSKNIRRNFSPLVFAILIHGIYDFFAAFDSPLKYFSVALILLAALECRIFYLRVRENLVSKKSSSPEIFDSEKTIEIPKSPALVISVKGGTENSAQETKEKKMFFEKKAENGAEDFEKIQKEAEAAIKAEESKKSVSRKSAKSENDSEKTIVKTSSEKKSASEKTVVKDSAPKKTGEKTTAKKSLEKNSASKANSTKGAAKKSSAKTSMKSTSASEKKSTQTKIPSKKISAEKTVVKKSSLKKSADSKKSTTKAVPKKTEKIVAKKSTGGKK